MPTSPGPHPRRLEASTARVDPQLLHRAIGTPHFANDAGSNNVRLHWSTTYPGFQIRGVGRFTSAQPYPFTNVTAVPVVLSDHYSMTNTHSRTNNGFFLLRKP